MTQAVPFGFPQPPTSAKIPFADLQASGLEEIGGASPSATNVLVDDMGVLRRRPGIIPFSGAPDSGSGRGVKVITGGVAALHAARTGAVYAIAATGSERTIYVVTSGAVTALGGGVPPAGLRGTLRPVIAETELLMTIAGGADVQKVELNTNLSARLAGGPPIASHVIANTSRLIANDLVLSPNTAHFSDIASGNSSYAGFEKWALGVGDAGVFSAESKPDAIVALVDNSNEVFCFGNFSLEVFQPDPNFVYARIATRELGCSAPYSIVKVDEQFFWLDHLHRFIKSDGRGFHVVSTPIQRVLDNIETVSDCFGYRVVEGYMDTIVWTFPTDGRTFAFNQKTGGFAEWTGWDSATANYTLFPVTDTALLPGSPKAIVGTTDGSIGQFDLSSATDFGVAIPASVTTGFIGHSTDALKQCKSVRASLKRGVSGGTPSAPARLSWRDRPGVWEPGIPIDLGSSGDTEIVLRFYGLGTYRRRQWKFEFSGTEDLSLVGVQEDFTVLGV